MRSISEILNQRNLEGKRYVTHEFQAYGYRLAEELDDLRHKALYIKLAKKEPRERLEAALEFVKAREPRSKAKLFMWKLKELRGDN